MRGSSVGRDRARTRGLDLIMAVMKFYMTMGTRIIIAIIAVTVLLGFCMGFKPRGAFALTAALAADSHSVWEGVYTQDQAKRGEGLYYHGCASCHGDKLNGKESENSPALTGQKFETQWMGRTVGDMYRKILRKMPDDDPGTLSPQQSADLVAYILSFNKFPAGKAELPADNNLLIGIRFDARKPDHLQAPGAPAF